MPTTKKIFSVWNKRTKEDERRVGCSNPIYHDRIPAFRK
jgi:hypothetical protein